MLFATLSEATSALKEIEATEKTGDPRGDQGEVASKKNALTEEMERIFPLALARFMRCPFVWACFFDHSACHAQVVSDGLWGAISLACRSWLACQPQPFPLHQAAFRSTLVQVIDFDRWHARVRANDESSVVVGGFHVRDFFAEHPDAWVQVVCVEGAPLLASSALLLTGIHGTVFKETLTTIALQAPEDATLAAVCDAFLSAQEHDHFEVDGSTNQEEASADGATTSTLTDLCKCVKALSAFSRLETAERLRVMQTFTGRFYTTLGRFSTSITRFVAAATSSPLVSVSKKNLILRVCNLYAQIVLEDPDELFDVDFSFQELIQATLDAIIVPSSPAYASLSPQESSMHVAVYRSGLSFYTESEREHLAHHILGSTLEKPGMAILVERAATAHIITGGSMVVAGILGQQIDDESQLLCAARLLANSLQRLADALLAAASCDDPQLQLMWDGNSYKKLSERSSYPPPASPEMVSAATDANIAMSILGWVIEEMQSDGGGAITPGALMKLFQMQPSPTSSSSSSSSSLMSMVMLVEGSWAPVFFALPVATACVNFMVCAVRHALREMAPMLLASGVANCLHPSSLAVDSNIGKTPETSDNINKSPSFAAKLPLDEFNRSTLYIAACCTLHVALSEHQESVALVSDELRYKLFLGAAKHLASSAHPLSVMSSVPALATAVWDQYRRQPGLYDILGKDFGIFAVTVLQSVTRALLEGRQASPAASPSDEITDALEAKSTADDQQTADGAGGEESESGSGAKTAEPSAKPLVQRELVRILSLCVAWKIMFQAPTRHWSTPSNATHESRKISLSEATHPGVTEAIYDATFLLLADNMTIGSEQHLGEAGSLVFMRDTGSTCRKARAMPWCTIPGLCAMADFLADTIRPLLILHANKPAPVVLYRRKCAIATVALILLMDIRRNTSVTVPLLARPECEGLRMDLLRCLVFVGMFGAQRNANMWRSNGTVSHTSPQHEMRLFSTLHGLFAGNAPIDNNPFAITAVREAERVVSKLSLAGALSTESASNPSERVFSPAECNLLMMVLGGSPTLASAYRRRIGNPFLGMLKQVCEGILAGSLATLPTLKSKQEAETDSSFRCAQLVLQHIVTVLRSHPWHGLPNDSDCDEEGDEDGPVRREVRDLGEGSACRVALTIAKECLPCLDPTEKAEQKGSASVSLNHFFVLPLLQFIAAALERRMQKHGEKKENPPPAAEPTTCAIGPNDASNDRTEKVQCPLCFKYFDHILIARHASACQGEDLQQQQCSEEHLKSVTSKGKPANRKPKSNRMKKKGYSSRKRSADDGDSEEDDDDEEETELSSTSFGFSAEAQRSLLSSDALLSLLNIDNHIQNFRAWFHARRCFSLLIRGNDDSTARISASWITQQTAVMASAATASDFARCAHLFFLFGGASLVVVLQYCPTLLRSVCHACFIAVGVCVQELAEVLDKRDKSSPQEQPRDGPTSTGAGKRSIGFVSGMIVAALSCLNLLRLEGLRRETCEAQSNDKSALIFGSLATLVATCRSFDLQHSESGDTPSVTFPEEEARRIARHLGQQEEEEEPPKQHLTVSHKESYTIAESCSRLLKLVPVTNDSTTLMLAVGQAQVALRIGLEVESRFQSEEKNASNLTKLISVELAMKHTIIPFSSMMLSTSSTVAETATGQLVATRCMLDLGTQQGFDDRHVHRSLAAIIRNIMLYEQEYDGTVFVSLSDDCVDHLISTMGGTTLPRSTSESCRNSMPHYSSVAVQFDVLMSSVQDMSSCAAFGFDRLVSCLQRCAKLIVFTKDGASRSCDFMDAAEKKTAKKQQQKKPPTKRRSNHKREQPTGPDESHIPEGDAEDWSQTYIWLSPETEVTGDESAACTAFVKSLADVIRTRDVEKQNQAFVEAVVQSVASKTPSMPTVLDIASSSSSPSSSSSSSSEKEEGALRIPSQKDAVTNDSPSSFDAAANSEEISDNCSLLAGLLLTHPSAAGVPLSLYSVATALRICFRCSQRKVAAGFKDLDGAVPLGVHSTGPTFRLTDVFPGVAALSALATSSGETRFLCANALRLPDIFAAFEVFLDQFIPLASHSNLRRDGEVESAAHRVDFMIEGKLSAPSSNEKAIQSVLILMFLAGRSPNQLSCYRHPEVKMLMKVQLKETGEGLGDEEYSDYESGDDDDSESNSSGDRAEILRRDDSSDEGPREALMSSGPLFRARVQAMNDAARDQGLVVALPASKAVVPTYRGALAALCNDEEKNSVASAPPPPWRHLLSPPFIADDFRFLPFLSPPYIAQPSLASHAAVSRLLRCALSLLHNRATDRFVLNVVTTLVRKTFDQCVSYLHEALDFCERRGPQWWHRAAGLIVSVLNGPFRSDCFTVFSSPSAFNNDKDGLETYFQNIPWDDPTRCPREARFILLLERVIGQVQRHTNAVSLLQLNSFIEMITPLDDEDEDDEDEDEEGEYASTEEATSDSDGGASRQKDTSLGTQGRATGIRDDRREAPLPPRFSAELPFLPQGVLGVWQHTYRTAEYGAKYTCEECESSCRGYRFFASANSGLDICPSCAIERATPDVVATPKDERMKTRQKLFVGLLLQRSDCFFQRLFDLLRHPLCIPVFYRQVGVIMTRVLSPGMPSPPPAFFRVVYAAALASVQAAVKTVELATLGMGAAFQELLDSHKDTGAQWLRDNLRAVAELIHNGDPTNHGSVDYGYTLLAHIKNFPREFFREEAGEDDLTRSVTSLQASLDQWLSAVNLILQTAGVTDVRPLQKHMTLREVLPLLLDAVLSFQDLEAAATDDNAHNLGEASSAAGTPVASGAAATANKSFFLSRSDTEQLTWVVDNRSSISDAASDAAAAPSGAQDVSHERVTEVSTLLATHRMPLSLVFLSIPDLSEFHSKTIDQFFLSPKLAEYSLRFEAHNSRCIKMLDEAFDAEMSVDRSNLLMSSLSAFHELLCDDEMFAEADSIVQVSISFEGEMGVDDGGPKREFINAFLHEVAKAGLFTQVPDTVTYEINPNPMSLPPPGVQTPMDMTLQDVYRVVGYVMGTACTNSIPVEMHLARSIYRHLIGLEPCFSDLEQLDPTLFKSLTEVSKMKTEEEFEALYQAFTVTVGDHHNQHDQPAPPSMTMLQTVLCATRENPRNEEVELIPGGASVLVCDANKKDYIRRRSQFRMTGRVSAQLTAFLEGFYKAHRRSYLRAFTAAELEVVLCGLPSVDIEDMRANSAYENCEVATPQVRWFWEWVAGLSQQDLAKLLQFSTGCSKVPAGGFAGLRNKFTLKLVDGPEDRLPVAHTCYATIDLPKYQSGEVLASKFRTALELGMVGFDLV